MEDMKAVYKLNEEKLDFNFKVLTERHNVNQNTITGLKNKKRRQLESRRSVMIAFDQQNATAQNLNIKYTEEYKKFTKQFKELQNKFKRFVKSDDMRFNEIWTMNEAEVRELINKIIQADRVVHVQQLGMSWQPPTDPIFGFAEGGMQSSHMAANTSLMDSSKHGMSKSEVMDDQSHTTA